MTPTAISSLARDLYKRASLVNRWLQAGRPYICPFDVLISHVPASSSVLDIGTGAGLFLGLLAIRQKISEGVGLDTSFAAIRVARVMAKRVEELGFPTRLSFEQVSVGDPWPSARFDVVSLIDVMHHVEQSQRRVVFRQAVSCLRPRGLLIYKDISERPRWRFWANRLHDLIVAREWIDVLPIRQVEDWASADNLELKHTAYVERLWYGHDLRVWSNATESHYCAN